MILRSKFPFQTDEELQWSVDHYEKKKTLKPFEHEIYENFRKELQWRKAEGVSIKRLHYVWTTIKEYGPFDTHQEAYDWMVNRYGRTHDGEIIENGEIVAATYTVLSNHPRAQRLVPPP